MTLTANGGQPLITDSSLEPFVRNFVRASLLWLGVGVLIGVSMAFWPGAALVYRPAHVHANLLGFVSMMIFGVAYHVIPRFSGNPLHRRELAVAHLWVANTGLALLVSGWITRVEWAEPGILIVRAGAALSAIGAYLFIYNLWRTLGERRLRSTLR
ncbi:MAG TPA: cbb3-type cytochrome c oxidase subunit I [Longimicrobiaceae bacterium]|nr:cbb3-type cytochrome c oxidase subunit I [Longimicrobiaceae bacterium]